MIWLLQGLYFCGKHNYTSLLFLYNLFVFLYAGAVRLAALRNAKAKEWLAGRKDLFDQLAQTLQKNEAPVVWVHSASTGEFEQAKPLIEAIRQHYPQYKIFATFFSPSGYHAAAHYAHIDYLFYLPLDTKDNAKRLLQLTKPSLVIFSKYDFWYHHLKAIKNARVPLLLTSALFRPGQAFFQWYGGFYKQMLLQFDQLFVQDQQSLQLLQQHGIKHCTISGDTRFDRVLAITKASTELLELASFEHWIKGRTCIVAGSTWAGDEALIAAVEKNYPDVCWIIAPHEINQHHVAELLQRFPNAFLYSQQDAAFPVVWDKSSLAWVNVEDDASAPLRKQYNSSNVLLVDAVGLLSRLYKLATITYVGGGFTKDGVHNTLEAAVWGKPVIIGPNYKKYREAKELVANGGAFAVQDAATLAQCLDVLLNNKAALQAASEASHNYVARNGGATSHIMAYIQEKRLLTN